MPEPSGFDKLVAMLKKIGYDTRVGPAGSFTYNTDETGYDPNTKRTSGSPLTVPLLPGLPGVVTKPQRELTPEEIRHEGTHAALGLPGAMLGQLGATAMGLSKSAGLMAPDEVLAYLSQPRGAATDVDMKTLSDTAGALMKQRQNERPWMPSVSSGYLNLVQALANMRRSK